MVDIFNKYLYNPKRTEDLNLSPWYVILTHLQQLIESKLWLTKEFIFLEFLISSETRQSSGNIYFQIMTTLNYNQIKPVFVIPLMQLLNRLLPCRPDDPYLGLWRLILLHEQIGDQLIETFIIYSHSAHPEVCRLAINIIKQFSLIRQGETTRHSGSQLFNLQFWLSSNFANPLLDN